MTGIPSVSGTTYSSVLVYGGSPQCSRNYLLFCPRLRRGPLCSRNYLLFCPRLRRWSLVKQELHTLLSSSTTRVPSVAGTTYSSLLVYDGDPSVSGTTYSSVLVYDGSPQCTRNYLLFSPRLRQGSLVQQELFTILYYSTTGVTSVAGTTYSSVLVYDGGPQCSRNYLLFCPRLRRGSLVQQELLTLLSSSTTGVPSVAGTTYSSLLVYDGDPSVSGTTYSSVLVYDGGPQCIRNYLLFCTILRRGHQCSRNYLHFCPRLRRGSLVQQELYTLLSSSTTGVPIVAGTIYSSVLVYDGGLSVARTTYSSVLLNDGGPQCSRNYLLFCPRLRRGPLVQQELLTLLSSSTTAALVQQELLTLPSSSTTGVHSVAGTTYSSVLVYDEGPQCSRNYILFCPRLRRWSLVQQELLTLLSSSTTGVLTIAETTYSSVLVYHEGPQCSKNYLLFCPRL